MLGEPLGSQLEIAELFRRPGKSKSGVVVIGLDRQRLLEMGSCCRMVPQMIVKQPPRPGELSRRRGRSTPTLNQRLRAIGGPRFDEPVQQRCHRVVDRRPLTDQPIKLLVGERRLLTPADRPQPPFQSECFAVTDRQLEVTQ